MEKKEQETPQDKVLKYMENQAKRDEVQTELLREIQKSLSQKPQITPTPSTLDSSKLSEKESPKHLSLADAARLRPAEVDCPDCKKNIETIAKNYLAERRTKPLVCKRCGVGVDKEEGECFSCGEKDAIDRAKFRYR